MVKRTFNVCLFLILGLSANAQQKVALQHNGATTIFSSANPFNDAYTAAVNGDTIYLPGGNIPTPAAINKSLVIFGAGHYPDSTLATAPTILNGSIVLQESAAGIHIEGVEINSDITFNGMITGAVIKRCIFRHITLTGENNTISECVITGGTNLSTSTASMISNNIIQGTISNGTLNGIANNILLYSSSSTLFVNVDNSSIINNIIFQAYLGNTRIHSGSDFSTFSYNLFRVTPVAANNTFENNNYYNVDISTIFVNQSGSTFDYSHDYHLVNPNMFVDVNNKQIGIYGGFFPYKPGSVPSNPHIIYKSISPETNASGEINVNIRVEAQDN